MNLPGFNDIFWAILGWSDDLGYIIRVHGQGVQPLPPEDAQSLLAHIGCRYNVAGQVL
jgi:hypothetical protein